MNIITVALSDFNSSRDNVLPESGSGREKSGALNPSGIEVEGV